MAHVSMAPPPPWAGIGSDRRARGYVLLGALLGLPFSYPTVPYYWAAFAVFGAALLVTPFERFKAQPRMLLAVGGLCMAAVASNLLSPYAYVREPARFLVTSSFYVFFLFGVLARDREREVLAGLSGAILVQALALLAASLQHFHWDRGLENWALAELRLWGQGLFPDWPNFYAILLSVGFLLFLLHYRRPLPAAVCMLAALLTTSRVPLVALAMGVGWLVVFGARRRHVLRVAVVALLAAPLAIALTVLFTGSEHLDDFIVRMTLMSDRAEIWRSSLSLFLAHPWLGIGGVMLDQSVGHRGYASFHNSYLEVLVRHGLAGFVLYLWLLFALVPRMRPAHAGSAIVAFLLITALFQNTLRHPHFFMMYSFLAVAALRKGGDER